MTFCPIFPPKDVVLMFIQEPLYSNQYLRQLSGLDFSAWAMNTTYWHQMFSNIRNKNQIRCLRMYFLISRVNTSP